MQPDAIRLILGCAAGAMLLAGVVWQWGVPAVQALWTRLKPQPVSTTTHDLVDAAILLRDFFAVNEEPEALAAVNTTVVCAVMRRAKT